MNVDANCTSIWPLELLVFDNMMMEQKYQCLLKFEVAIPPSTVNANCTSIWPRNCLWLRTWVWFHNSNAYWNLKKQYLQAFWMAIVPKYGLQIICDWEHEYGSTIAILIIIWSSYISKHSECQLYLNMASKLFLIENMSMGPDC